MPLSELLSSRPWSLLGDPHDGWPDEPSFGNSQQGVPFPTYGCLYCLLWPVPALVYWLIDYFVRQRKRTVKETPTEGLPEDQSPRSPRRRIRDMEEGGTPVRGVAMQAVEYEGDDEVEPNYKLAVLVPSLEHSLPQFGVKATAGGLGKVIDVMRRYHPTDLYMVHPMLPTSARIKYGELIEDEAVVAEVDGNSERVRVFTCEIVDRQPGRRVIFYLLKHPLFEHNRSKERIYPNPMSRRQVLAFFSLWNQAVGLLMARLQPAVFHCPDFHTAVSPWYALRQNPNLNLKVLLVLHNAEYQGTISTDMIRGSKLDTIASIWNLPQAFVERHLIQAGRFNMLKAVVDFLLERQGGKGACAVSGHYARECLQMYSVFWQLPGIEGLDNPMLEAERPPLEGSLAERKAEAKRSVQESFGLQVDPDARLFVSLGRLVRQKGVDLLADVAPWLLREFPTAQLVVLGPPGDGFGEYAAQKLQQVAEDPDFQGRCHIRCEWVEVGAELKLAADFCLMPSRDEPFGYVDIEFAWHGALLVGAQAGGLGKVPGFYYIAQNRENLGRLRKELKREVGRAMTTRGDRIAEMQARARQCRFPLGRWQARLLSLYQELLPVQAGDRMVAPSNPLPPGMEMQQMQRPERPERHSAEHVEPRNNGSLIEQLMHRPSADASFEVEPGREFLRQELAEEELTEKVQAKIEAHPSSSIDGVLEAIGADLDAENEEKVGSSVVSQWLLRPTFGVARVHILVALGYIAAPVAECLIFVIATEWSIRGGMEFPGWVQRLTRQQSGVDPPALNMLLFSINALGFAIGAPIWAVLCRFVQPRRLMGASLLMKVPIVLAIAPISNPSFSLAFALTFGHGLVSSAALLFIVFNFMMSIQADMSKAAVRMGVLEVFRYCVNWVVTGYVFIASPSSAAGTAEDPLPPLVSWLLLPIALVMVLLTLVPGLLMLYAPGPYREDRFPGWELSLIGKRKSFLLLALSECLGSLGLYPGTCYITWWLANGWQVTELGPLSFLVGLAIAGGTVLWAFSLSRASVHGFSFLIGLALLLVPPMLVRAIALEEVSTFTSLGRSEVAMILSVLSLFFESVRSSAIWTAKIRILNSRWRLLSYGTIILTVSQFIAAASPWVCEFMARHGDKATFISSNQKELADATIISLAPICIIQAVLQVSAAPFVHKDIGAVTQEKRTPGLCRRILRNAPACFAVLAVMGFACGTYKLKDWLVDRAIPYFPVRPCTHSGLYPSHLCESKGNYTNLNEASAAKAWYFGPNRFGQSTTGRYNCFRRMENVGADTFTFDPDTGHCEVWLCGKHGLNKTDTPVDEEVEVWSQTCKMWGQNIVTVALFEWPWKDVANECERFLGKAGVKAVEVSPPWEHVQGDGWAVRYQPVSHQLISRSGNRDDFIDMVKRCQAANVAVMVDVVLNHMAAPVVYTPRADRGKLCGQEVDTDKKSTRACKGWTGKLYGNRQFVNNKDGPPGTDVFNQDDFHHYPGNTAANCAWPPYENNIHLCDMSGLPDLNTEHRNVQKTLLTYLFELYEIGVTMLRVDAAMMIYPESLATILQPIPWQYVVQEYYPAQLMTQQAVEKITTIGAATEFNFGWRLFASMSDSYFQGNWSNRSYAFKELLQLRENSEWDCKYSNCKSSLPAGREMLFVDNHDSQRERWKPPEKDKPEPGWEFPNASCKWDGLNVDGCRLNYKNGFRYNLAQRYMLAWPYGDAVWLTSSYAWTRFDEGPPGVRNDSLTDFTPPGITCRGSPTTSPVTAEYDTDSNRWVCEHRWRGVLALVRFRQVVGKEHEVHMTWSMDEGFLGWCLGDVAFVAMSRGYEWATGMGSNKTLNLTTWWTPLKAGVYCNLAEEYGVIPEPRYWGQRCTGPDPVEVGKDGRIVGGFLHSGSMVVLHADYFARVGSAEAGEEAKEDEEEVRATLRLEEA